ncbi:Bardet-Biedl syndrome 4 protein [Cladochytrium tenue]|nr:Bardet-Biedl syndrome 4 protein [Cladochytrium tenue]
MLPTARSDPTILKLAARGHLLRGRFRDALDAYTDAMRFAGEDWAEAAFLEALSIYPHDSTYMELGRLYAATLQDSKAIALLQEALMTYPSCPELLKLLGQLHTRAGGVHDAIACFERLVELEPDSAERYLEEANQLADDSSGSTAAIADASRRAADERLATLYRHALLLTPNPTADPDLWNNLAVWAADHRRPAAAAACLDRAVAASAGRPVTAVMTVASSQVPQPTATDRPLLLPDPTRARVLTNLAAACLRGRQLASAAASADAAAAALAGAPDVVVAGEEAGADLRDATVRQLDQLWQTG